MTMHTEEYCKTLAALDPAKAIRAIHQALLQLNAVTRQCDLDGLDTIPAMESLCDCLRDAGHPAFPPIK